MSLSQCFCPKGIYNEVCTYSPKSFYPCPITVCFKVLFECPPPFLTFELHTKIKCVILTNASFVIMMTNGKQILKKTHNAIRCLDYKVSPPVVWFLETNRTQTCGCSNHSVQASYCNCQLRLHCFTVERDTREINYLRYFWKTHNNGTI